MAGDRGPGRRAIGGRSKGTGRDRAGVAAEAAVAGWLAAGNVAEARAAADAWLARAGLPGAEMAAACRWNATVCRAAGDWFAALQWGTLALRQAEAAGAPDQVALAHLELGQVKAALGDVAPARTHIQAFLAAAPGLPAGSDLQAAAHDALGRAALAAGDYPAAGAAWARAAELHPLPGTQAQAYVEATWAFLMARRPADALPYLQTVDARQDDLTPGARAWHLANRALWLRLTGSPAAAISAGTAVLQLPAAGEAHRAQAAWVAGLACLDRGDWAGAQGWGRQALDHAIRAGRPLWVDLAQALVQQAAGDPT